MKTSFLELSQNEWFIFIAIGIVLWVTFSFMIKGIRKSNKPVDFNPEN